MTSELTGQEVQAILAVQQITLGGDGNEELFRWKYLENPYGDSLHAIVYDGDHPVASASFWRNDLDDCTLINA